MKIELKEETIEFTPCLRIEREDGWFDAFVMPKEIIDQIISTFDNWKEYERDEEIITQIALMRELITDDYPDRLEMINEPLKVLELCKRTLIKYNNLKTVNSFNDSQLSELQKKYDLLLQERDMDRELRNQPTKWVNIYKKQNGDGSFILEYGDIEYDSEQDAEQNHQCKLSYFKTIQIIQE